MEANLVDSRRGDQSLLSELDSPCRTLVELQHEIKELQQANARLQQTNAKVKRENIEF